MMEDEFWKAIVQYGAIGIIAAYLGYKDFTINKKLLEVLTDIKEAFNISITQNKILEDSLNHERKRSEDCYARIVARLDEYFAKLKDCIQEEGK